MLLGQSAARLDVLQDMMAEEPDLRVERRVLMPGARAPLAATAHPPDVLLLDLGENWHDELQHVHEGAPSRSRPPMIVLGGTDEPSMMRRAMQAGARDFYGDDVSDEELVASVRRVGLEARFAFRQSLGSLTVVINGKGGAGSSFISSCLATVPMVPGRHHGASVALLDLDTQFGDLPVYFDMKCDDNLIQALGTVDELDPVALDGFMRTHASGVRILAGRHEETAERTRFGAEEIGALLRLLTQVHDHVVVDLPRRLDAEITAALELADQVVVITQQTVPHVRNARFVVGLLRDIGLPDKSVKVLVNRFEKSSQVRMADVRDVFDDFDIYTVPNDYKRALHCVDNGTPLLGRWPKSPVARSVVALAEALWPDPANVDGGKGRASWFRRPRT